MFHIRLSMITADALEFDACLNYLESEVRPALAGEPGSMGLSLLASTAADAAIFGSVWALPEWMTASDDTEAPLRGELARRAGGSLTVETYEIPVFERHARMRAGQAVRLARMSVAPSRVDDAIHVVGDTVVPLLTENPGFRSALLFADPGSGHLISETVWLESRTRAASPNVPAIMRTELLDEAHFEAGPVEDYSLAFSTVWDPES